MENLNMLGLLTQASDPKTIKFVAHCPDTKDYMDAMDRWFRFNTIVMAFKTGLLIGTNDPNVFELADGVWTFLRDDGCTGFSNKPREKRH